MQSTKDRLKNKLYKNNQKNLEKIGNLLKELINLISSESLKKCSIEDQTSYYDLFKEISSEGCIKILDELIISLNEKNIKFKYVSAKLDNIINTIKNFALKYRVDGGIAGLLQDIYYSVYKNTSDVSCLIMVMRYSVYSLEYEMGPNAPLVNQDTDQWIKFNSSIELKKYLDKRIEFQKALLKELITYLRKIDITLSPSQKTFINDRLKCIQVDIEKLKFLSEFSSFFHSSSIIKNCEIGKHEDGTPRAMFVFLGEHQISEKDISIKETTPIIEKEKTETEELQIAEEEKLEIDQQNEDVMDPDNEIINPKEVQQAVTSVFSYNPIMENNKSKSEKYDEIIILKDWIWKFNNKDIFWGVTKEVDEFLKDNNIFAGKFKFALEMRNGFCKPHGQTGVKLLAKDEKTNECLISIKALGNVQNGHATIGDTRILCIFNSKEDHIYAYKVVNHKDINAHVSRFEADSTSFRRHLKLKSTTQGNYADFIVKNSEKAVKTISNKGKF